MDVMPLILFLVMIAYAWWETIGAKRQARKAARRACARATVRFLDELGLIRLRLRRDARGRWHLWRLYGFEFCLEGDVRFPGRVELTGRRVTRIELAGQVIPPAGWPPAVVVEGNGDGGRSREPGP